MAATGKEECSVNKTESTTYIPDESESSCSSEDEDVGNTGWSPYKGREEWQDVTPLPLHEGNSQVVQIAYSAKFKDVYSYFRAVLKSNEVSERALQLSRDAATLNPANYTVWNYRRHLLYALSKDLHHELKFVGDIIFHHPKNYQVWHHRQCIVSKLMDPSKEKVFTELILKKDSKNYHCWQYRQWLDKEFCLWDGELQFCEKLIHEDVMNNSAWNHRYFVLNGTVEFTNSIISREVEYAASLIRKIPDNESPWNYLRGLFLGRNLYDNGQVREFVESLFSSGCRSSHLLSMILDMSMEEIETLQGDGDGSRREQLINRALEICELLSEKHDRIRRNYWNYIARQLKGKTK